MRPWSIRSCPDPDTPQVDDWIEVARLGLEELGAGATVHLPLAVLPDVGAARAAPGARRAPRPAPVGRAARPVAVRVGARDRVVRPGRSRRRGDPRVVGEPPGAARVLRRRPLLPGGGRTEPTASRSASTSTSSAARPTSTRTPATASGPRCSTGVAIRRCASGRASRLQAVLLLRDLMGNGRPRGRDHGARLFEQERHPGDALLLRAAASPPTATTSRPTPSSAAPPRSSASARSGSACPRWWSTTCGPRWARRRPASTATRRPSCGWRASPARTARPPRRSCVREILEAAGIQTGLLGTVKQVVGGVEEAVERTTPEAIDLQATFRRMLDARRRRLRDGGLLARARARPRERASASRPRSSPTSPRTTSTSTRRWRTTSSPSGGCSTSPGPASSTSTTSTGAGSPPRCSATPSRSRSNSEADYRARDVRFDVAGARSPSTLRTGRSSSRRGCPGLFNVPNALAALATARALGVDAEAAARGPRRAPGGCRGASSRSRRGRTSGCSSTTRTRPTRSRTCCAPRAS